MRWPQIRSAFRSGQPETIADHVTDDMLWSIAICGDDAQAREMLATRKRLPDMAFASPPSFLVGRSATRRLRRSRDARAVAAALTHARGCTRSPPYMVY